VEHPEKKFKLIQEEGMSLLLDENSGERIRLALGTNVTGLIGIKKYEPTETGVCIGGKPAGFFPSFIQKTDQKRIQNLPHWPQKYTDLEFEITEKLEGSSITCYYHNGRFGICSRNFELKQLDNNESVAVQTLLRLGIREKLLELKLNIALQGEIIGPGIQGNIYKLREHEWRVFDVFLINEQRYATHAEREEILDKLQWKLRVPFLGMKVLNGLTVETLLEMAIGTSQLKKDVQREGIVFKSTRLVKGKTKSFKAISNVYLLKQK
jgi:RNA ligase (TIGR02306 family)